jgi:hypothetical protein
MDLRTVLAIKRINLHTKVKKYLTIFCYFLIIVGIFIYIFYAINKPNQQYKVINDYQKNPEKFQIEKIMVNPRIKFQHTPDQVYDINAKRAVHKNEEEITLFDVYAVGVSGNIAAGQLIVNDNGNHLVFSQNPVLILNKTDNDE